MVESPQTAPLYPLHSVSQVSEIILLTDPPKVVLGRLYYFDLKSLLFTYYNRYQFWNGV